MLHDNKRKTIFYEHAVVKSIDIPIFYLPKLSHPDPTVERSGFLPPKFSDTKNLGMGISSKGLYFWDIAKDKILLITNRISCRRKSFVHRRVSSSIYEFKFLADFGFTEGYKDLK